MADGELHKFFKAHLKGFHYQRIESGGTALGIPDLNYCGGGAEGWIENKWTSSWKVKVRTEQVGWIEQRARYGGRVFIAVRQTGKDRNDLWLLAPGTARLLYDGMRLDLLPSSTVLVHSTGGPSSWDWAKVKECMQVKNVNEIKGP